jgi:aspartate aminotransferase
MRAPRPSATVAINETALGLRRQGIDVITLAAGEPDGATPQPVVAATWRALSEEGYTHYTDSRGILELRQAIARKLARENGVSYDPGTEILVTPGAKQGLFYACLAFLDEGLEALVPEPAWVSYAECVTVAGGRYVPVPLDPARGFLLTEESLEKRVTKATRMILLNTPCNPTGRVLARREIDAVATVARRHDLLVLSDEIYEKLVFEGEHHSIAAWPGMRERTLTLNGFSKVFAMTGFRLGYIAGPAQLVAPLVTLQQHSATCPTAFVQRGAVDAVESSQDFVARQNTAFRQRRDRLVEALSKVEGLSVSPPEGTFYLFLGLGGRRRKSTEVARRLLEEAHVALTPGVAFGKAGEGFLRLSFAAADGVLDEAVRRIARAFPRIVKG